LPVLASLIHCQPQFQQFSPPGHQFQQLGRLQGRPHQLGGFQGQPQQLGRLQARRVKFGDRTSRAQSLCTDFSNCQFGYTFNPAELDTDNGESVNTQFSLDAFNELPPLTNRISSTRSDIGPQQNTLQSFQPSQNTRPAIQLSQNTHEKLPSSPRRPEPQQSSLPAFPQFDLSSSKFDLQFPQFNFPSQPALSTNSLAHNPSRRISNKPRSTTRKPTALPRSTTTPQPTTTTKKYDYAYVDNNDIYYYDQYEESFNLQDDDVKDDSSEWENNDYSYDYNANTCPGSLEECISVCVPLEDIYVYSICVKECADRCN